MITKGKLVGQIIDSLSIIQNNMNMRSKLHLYDLNTYCEYFAMHILNYMWGYNLKNLNDEHMNEPGLDLGDEVNRIAFQVTATKSGTKVDETLSKITADQRNQYDRFVVFILGEKQGSYKIKNPSEIPFDPKKDIIDFNDIALKAFSLNLSVLESVSSYIAREAPKLLAEIEVKQKGEEYSESLYNNLEQLPTPQNAGYQGLINFIQNKGDFSLTELQIFKSNLDSAFDSIAKLPRISREFLCILFEKSKYEEVHGCSTMPLDELFKFLSISESKFQDELSYLLHKKLISLNDVDTDLQKVVYISLAGGFHLDFISTELQEFLLQNNIKAQELFVQLDFRSIS